VTSVTDVQVTQRRLTLGPALETRARASGALVRRHWPFAVVLAVATILRVIAEIAVFPGMWFSDGNGYIHAAATGTLTVTRTSGYSLLVAPFYHLGSAGAASLIIVQHLIGLGAAVALYALLLRRGASKTIACFAVLPAALDGYVIALEHMIMSETTFSAALVACFVALLWRDRLTWPTAALAGVLLAYAGTVRSVALPCIVLFVIYLLVRRVGWRMLGVFLLGWAVVLGGYMSVYKVEHGKFGFTSFDGRFLYGEVATFANCSKLPNLPADERRFCPSTTHRMSPNGYVWSHTSRVHGVPVSLDGRIRDFDLRVLRQNPGAYVKEVTGDFVHYFEPGHRVGRWDYPVVAWQFPKDPRHWGYPAYRGPIRAGIPGDSHKINPGPSVDPMTGGWRVSPAASSFLHTYQRFFYTSGQILALCVILVLVGLVRRRVPWRNRLDGTLVAATALVALAMAAALSVFDYRYGLVAVIFLPVAAVLAVSGGRTVGAAVRGPAPRPLAS
jgi:hypothetical protein